MQELGIGCKGGCPAAAPGALTTAARPTAAGRRMSRAEGPAGGPPAGRGDGDEERGVRADGGAGLGGGRDGAGEDAADVEEFRDGPAAVGAGRGWVRVGRPVGRRPGTAGMVAPCAGYDRRPGRPAVFTGRPGHVAKVPSLARRAGRAASGACSGGPPAEDWGSAGRKPSSWMYLGPRPVRREGVRDVARQAGLSQHAPGRAVVLEPGRWKRFRGLYAAGDRGFAVHPGNRPERSEPARLRTVRAERARLRTVRSPLGPPFGRFPAPAFGSGVVAA